MNAREDQSALIESLTNTVRVLADELAVLRLLSRVCHTIDGEPADPWLDCYTETGIFAYSLQPGAQQLFALAGREERRAWHVQHRSTVAVGKQNHLTVNPIVTISGDRAHASSYYTSIREVDGSLVVASTGRYEDDLVRDADGQWRIALRHATGDMPRR